MEEMTHIMVDTETTDVVPEIGGIIQLAAMKFNPETFKVGAHFDRCPMIQPRRRWSEGTKDFWMRQNRATYQTIVARQEPARAVFQAFADFCCDGAPYGGYIFVAKPLKFDWPMIESNMLDLDIPFPFAHWNCLDMHSWISGLRGTSLRTNIEDEVPFPAGGSKHNALHDVAWQIDCMFHAKRNHVTAEVA